MTWKNNGLGPNPRVAVDLLEGGPLSNPRARYSTEHQLVGREQKPNALRKPAGPRSRAGLLVRIHADAFRYDPVGYFQAIVWRLMGLRVRSRNKIAPLLGRSPAAYAYWVGQHEMRLHRHVDLGNEIGGAAIVPIIDCRLGVAGLASSLASCPLGSTPIIIGGESIPGMRCADGIAGVATLMPDGETWICPIACGDLLAPNALATYAKVQAAYPGAKLIYADDDLIDDSGTRHAPHFKPRWNPELFEWHDFLTGACVIRATKDEIAGLPDTHWGEALVREAVGKRSVPVHVQEVLHHRISRPEPIVPAAAKVHYVRAPHVTLIIPTRNREELLRKLIDGIGLTDYPSLDVIVVDNASDEVATLAFLALLERGGVNVIRAGGPFNYSALNNLAVRHAKGELLCFLNNDVEITHPEWLRLLVRQAVRLDIGAVGARLLYPDGTVQHAGVFTGIGGGAAHAHRNERLDEPGYFKRSRLPQRVSAVTGACLVVSKAKFEAVGGFDEEQFAVAFNDVDLCLKLNESGWQSFYEARATLIHHESKSRGSDRLRANRSRFAQELAALKRKWGTDVTTDPYHHPQLSPFCEQFVIAV